MLTYSITYSTYTQADLEAGSTDDHGFESESRPISIRDLVDEIQNGGYGDEGGADSGTLSNGDEDVDYATGDVTMRDLHIEGCTRSTLARILRLAGIHIDTPHSRVNYPPLRLVSRAG